MSQNWQRGDLVPFGFQATGGPSVLLNIKGHTLDLSVLLYDVTNTGTFGARARLTGTLDASGSIKLSFDLDNPFYGPISMRPGQKGVASFGVNAAQTRFISFGVAIEKVGIATAIEQEVQQPVDVKLDINSGLLIYPPLGSP
jgi:hypothetical protein